MKSDAQINHTIDWINVTIPNAQKLKYPSFFRRDFIECNGMHGYSVGKQFLDGRREFSNPDRPDMGTHIQFSGGTIKLLDEMYDTTPYNLVGFYSGMQHKFTRFDVAIDCHNTGLDMDRLESEIADKKVSCRSKKYERTYDILTRGGTIYIGRGSKYRYLRIYDKAEERKLPIGNDWKRIELQCNTKTANQTAERLYKSKQRARDAQALVKGYCDFTDYRIWNMIIGNEYATVKTPPSDDPKTMQWLLKTCAPSLARLMLFHGQSVRDEFNKTVDAELMKLHSKVLHDRDVSVDAG